MCVCGTGFRVLLECPLTRTMEKIRGVARTPQRNSFPLPFLGWRAPPCVKHSQVPCRQDVKTSFASEAALMLMWSTLHACTERRCGQRLLRKHPRRPGTGRQLPRPSMARLCGASTPARDIIVGRGGLTALGEHLSAAPSTPPPLHLSTRGEHPSEGSGNARPPELGPLPVPVNGLEYKGWASSSQWLHAPFQIPYQPDAHWPLHAFFNNVLRACLDYMSSHR